MSAPTTPSSQDLQVPFDPTAYTVIDGAQLGQLVNGAYPVNGIGLIVVTSDSAGVPSVPNATTTPKWQNYIWIRVGASTVTSYVWNPNGSYSSTTLYWQTLTTANIAPYSITGGTGGMLALNTVTAANIVSLTYSQLTGAPALAAGTSTALTSDGLFNSAFFNSNVFVWGDLIGSGNTPGTPVVKPLAITASKIANATITPTQLAPAGTANYQLTDITGSAPGWTLTPSIVQSGSPVTTSTGNALKIPQVATASGVDGGTWQMVSPNTSSFGRLLQMFSSASSLAATTNKTLAMTGTAPTTSNTAIFTGFGASGVVSFTPVSATSTIYIDVVMQIGSDSNTTPFIVLFEGSTAIAAASAYSNSTAGNATLHLQYKLASVGTSALSFSVYYAAPAGNTYINSVEGTATGVAALIGSIIKFTEVI